MTGPPSWNHTAAALMTDSAKMKRPTPSRRCSGSSSRAPWPIPRATAPMPWATASQTAATPRKTVSKKRAIGPLPVRTARGAGRRLRLAAPLPPPPRRAAGFRVGFFLLDAVLLCFRVLRARASRTVRRSCSCFANPAGKTYGSPRQHPRQSSLQSQGPHWCVSAVVPDGAHPASRACAVLAKPDDFHPSPHQPHRSQAPEWPPEVLIHQGFTGDGPVLRVRSGDRAPPGCTPRRMADRLLVENFSSEANLVKILKQGLCLALLGAGLAAVPATLAARRRPRPQRVQLASRPTRAWSRIMRDTASGSRQPSTEPATGEVGFARGRRRRRPAARRQRRQQGRGGAKADAYLAKYGGAFGAGQGQLSRSDVRPTATAAGPRRTPSPTRASRSSVRCSGRT